MIEPSDELDRLLVRAIGETRDRVRPSSFHDDWHAAQRRLAADPGPAPNAWQGVAACAVVALAVVGVALLAPRDDDVLLRQTPIAEHVDPPVVYSTIWYSTTDALLDVQSLEYTARPARLTVYDPITLEVIP